MKFCSVQSCNNKHYANGTCRKHYARVRRRGVANPDKADKGGHAIAFLRAAILHKGNDCLLWPYAKINTGYGHVTFNRRNLLAHRMVLSAWKLCPGPKLVAAHLCGNGHLGCVNPQHLAWATQRENLLHRCIHLAKA